MNKALWKEIEKFDLDFPLSEYGFSTRLAYENEWTEFFTQKAIEEYKKFMYLAATSNQMVSPSEIVDIVWHQHLIFTQSYKEFCIVLGKKIEHIPSTHNKEEKDKFLVAKQLTKELYEIEFGLQPKEFWEFNSFTEVFQVEKSNTDIIFYSILAIPSIIITVFIFRYLLYDVYVSINNPLFGFLFVLITATALLGLRQYNKFKQERFLETILPNTIIENLTPSELICMETNQLKAIIHGYVNFLVVSKNLKVDTKDNIKLINSKIDDSNSIFKVILDCFEEKQTLTYKELLEILLHKPIISKVSKTVSTISDVFSKSKAVLNLYKLNLIVYSFLITLGLTRVMIGFVREKEISFIILLNVLFLIVAYKFLMSLPKKMSSSIIPRHFKEKVIPVDKVNYNTWEWNYFVIGTGLLSVSFMPIVETYSSNNNNSSCGSGCSSCGSSCGGGCGGCGGD